MNGSTKFVRRMFSTGTRITRSIPFLKQGSTLSIRSQVKTDLRIRSHWRDDGEISFSQQNHASETKINSSAGILLSRNADKMTSLGREDPHVSIHVLDKDGIEELAHNENSDGDGTTILLSEPHAMSVTTKESEIEESLLTLDVPDKINIDCDLTEGGSIFVEGKVEGDVQFKTSQGNITVQKLRGHNIDLEIASMNERRGRPGEAIEESSFIYVSDVLESQSLRLSVPRPSIDRIRAKRIHAKTMEILIGESENQSITSTSSVDEIGPLFDSDDSGAICDISSLYIIGDATVDVQHSSSLANERKKQRQAVRIKSHHGHVHVQASAPKLDRTNHLTGDLLPLVDLGGVNGSCEVWVSRLKSENESADDAFEGANDEWTSCHVHFDSIAPDSVSLLHAEEGAIHVTVDRKVESDVRLFSPPSIAIADVDAETLLLEDNEDGSMADEVSHMLQETEKNAVISETDKSNSGGCLLGNNAEMNRIRIETQAFTSRERVESQELKYCEFVDGWIENTTSEPDSRFDRKIRGTGGGGKINIDGAKNQALHGFGIEKSSGDEMVEDSFARPLLAVSSPDKIVLETLSWMGNIARRYGLDDKRDDDDLGKQATRRKGLGREIPDTTS